METWVPVIVAAVSSPLLVKGVEMFTSWVTRREGKKRTDLDRAWSARDREARKRRIVEEHAHSLRRMLIEAPCIEFSDIPPWPTSGTGPVDTKGSS